MTYLALKMFGKQLYANISAAIAELVANGLDANAENVYVYMDIIEKNNATIAIFDDGDGMDSDSLEKEYAVIGRNKRKELKPEEAVKKMGRKGIGKLAALYLSDKYYIITKKESMTSPEFWELDVSNIVNNEQTPRLDQVEMLSDDVMFLQNLIDAKKGTIILLKDVKIRNFGDAAELALENKLANYFLTSKLSQKIKLCIRKKNNQKIKFKEVKKDIAHKNMAIIYTSNKKMFKKIVVIPIFLSILMFFASVSGVFATWFFAEESPESVNQSKGITISEFVWKPEEILPDITPGQNYLDLHNSILENVKGGLNSSKDTLEDAVLRDDDGLLHSSQNVQGGNLTHLFITQATRELDFIVKYVSDNEFWVFMYEDAKATNGSAGITEI